MSRYVAKTMFLKKSKWIVIWNRASIGSWNFRFFFYDWLHNGDRYDRFGSWFCNLNDNNWRVGSLYIYTKHTSTLWSTGLCGGKNFGSLCRLHHRLAHFIFINALLDHALKNALLDHNCKWFKDIEMIYKLNGNSTLNESK